MRNRSQLRYYHENVAEKAKQQREAAREAAMAANDGHLYPKRICVQCGKEYWPTKHHQKYCSEACCDEHYEMTRLQRDPAEKEGHRYFKRTCVVCGKEFWPNGPNDLSCSPECANERIKQRKKESYAAKKSGEESYEESKAG